MTIQQISIFVENKAGRLAEVTRLLAEHQIDLRALSLADTSDFGILRIIVNDVKKASAVLTEAGCIYKVSDVLAVAVADKPGGMAGVLDMLGNAGISLEYTYAFIARSGNTAYMICRVDDNAKAIETLTAAGIQLVGQSEIAKL
jgi:hypothetical protein